MIPDWQRQQGFALRCEWGAIGAQTLIGAHDIAVVVDVLSFSTTVSVAMDRGMRIRPRDALAVSAADASSAFPCAARREDVDAEHPWSLSPLTIRNGPYVPELVLPSPNGAAVSQAAVASGAVVFAGGLRNARATASAIAAARAGSGSIVVIPAGERWPDQSLRPAIEDLLGAGAVIAALVDACGLAGDASSPEAELALRAFRTTHDLRDAIMGSVSGRELLTRGLASEIEIACEFDASDHAARFLDGAFSRA